MQALTIEEGVTGSHVKPTMRDFLAIDGRARLHACWDRIWIPTAATRDAFVTLQDCMDAGSSTKPRGAIITGEADTGKSSTLTAFRDANPAEDEPGSPYARFPVVYVQAPDSANIMALYKSILAAIGHPLLYNATEPDLKRHTVNMIRGCRVGTVIIDEIGDISNDRLTQKVVDFLRSLKSLINDTGRPFVVSGTPSVLDLIGNEEQIAGRLNNVVRLAPLSRSDFAKAVLAFEKLLPLRRPSDLRSQPETVLQLYTLTDGLIGRLSYLLHDACVVAIETKQERITAETVSKVKDRSIKTVGRR